MEEEAEKQEKRRKKVERRQRVLAEPPEGNERGGAPFSRMIARSSIQDALSS